MVSFLFAKGTNSHCANKSQLYSALYKMLPSSKKSLNDGGLSPKAAEWVLIACFLAGVFGIQIVSRFLHHFMPSHVVDCDHTHEDEENQGASHEHHEHNDHDHNHRNHSHENEPPTEHKPPANGHADTERTPLLTRSGSIDGTVTGHFAAREMSDISKASPMPLGNGCAPSQRPPLPASRPSIQSRTFSSVKKLVSGSKVSCDTNGPCYGYSDPCGQECFRNISHRGGVRAAVAGHLRPTSMLRQTASLAEVRSSARLAEASRDRVRNLEALRMIDEDAISTVPPPATINLPCKTSNLDHQPRLSSATATSSTRPDSLTSASQGNPSHDHDDHDHDDHDHDHATTTTQSHSPHHHHVPQNAFLSLSLQTSVAIALHKLPEGFITYATNHANPTLGFTVFLALAIHNISEGFALALPLYLATQSRFKALLYSFVLGGLSQPLGAAVAAVWLKLAERGRGEWTPGERVYGGMFAGTAGIMASVAVSLLLESVELSHSKGVCVVFVFVGMGILGVSSALTA